MGFEYSLSKASVFCSKMNKEHSLLKSGKEGNSFCYIIVYAFTYDNS